MALAPVLSPDQLAGIKKEMLQHVTRAELDRARHQKRIQDCYKYALPWRHKFEQETFADQLDEVFDETAMTVVEDFSADMLNTFTPMKAEWVEIKPSVTLDSGGLNQIKEALEKYRAVLFGEMLRSNLYMALQEAYLDLGPGTMSLTIQDINAADPIHCQAHPMTEMLIVRGPYGFVGGQFRRWHCPVGEVKVIWPRAIYVPPALAAGEQTVLVTDGCWRVWTDKGNERHRYAVMINDNVVYTEEYIGQGSSPFVTARWSKDSTTAWGIGPTYRTTPAIKTLNHVRYLDLKNYDKIVDPNVSYENDGEINVDHGVTPGDWIPRAPGSIAPVAIESKARLDYAVFERDELRAAIRRAHYQDEPEQLGKTPPTATQWADLAARKARRMGTPATNLVHELQYPIIRRFAYLLKQRGVLPEVKLNGREISLIPVSPLLRAQEQEEVVRIDRFLEIVNTRYGPEMTAVLTKPTKVVGNIANRMGIPADHVTGESELAAAVKMVAPLIAGGGAPAAEGA